MRISRNAKMNGLAILAGAVISLGIGNYIEKNPDKISTALYIAGGAALGYLGRKQSEASRL